MSRLSLALLFLSPALAGPVVPSPAMPEQIQGFRWATRDPKTGQVTMILAGASATTKSAGPIEVVKPTVTFFDRLPSGPSPRPAAPSTTAITAEHAVYRRDNGLLSLTGKVVVTRSDGTVVRTESLEWSEAEGKFSTEAAAELSDGASLIAGTGLKGEMAETADAGRILDRVTLGRDVRTTLAGAQLAGLDDLFASAVPASSGPASVTISCGGAMEYQRRAATIRYAEGVVAKDALRSLEARSLDLSLGPDRRIVRLTATGGVKATGPRGEEASGETFAWDAATARAMLSGAPYVRVEEPEGTIRAAGIVHDRPSGKTEFSGPGVIDLKALPPLPTLGSDAKP